MPAPSTSGARSRWPAGSTAAATMGQLIFLDLRDRYGMTQVVIDAAESPEAHAIASRRAQRVRAAGRRAASQRACRAPRTPKLATGDVESARAAIDGAVDGEDAAVPHQRARTPPIDEALRLQVSLPGPAPRADAATASWPAIAAA